MVYQVLIVPRARPPPKPSRRRKARKASKPIGLPQARGVTKAVMPATGPPTMVRSLSRSSVSTASSASSTDWSDVASVSSAGGSRASPCASPKRSVEESTAAMQRLLGSQRGVRA